jgi:uroporphyrinogen decarboxylase
MNSRDRILTALNHREPDRIPFDLAGTTCTGIRNTVYQNLRKYPGMQLETPVWSDVIQQIVIPSGEILKSLNTDVCGIFPLTSHNWNVYSKLKDCGDFFEYFDEWGFTHHFPKNGHWFSLVKHLMSEVDFDTEGLIESYLWPEAASQQRFIEIYKGKGAECKTHVPF